VKFEITPEQADVLTTCIYTHDAANKTLNEALKYHQEVMAANQKLSDEIWRDFEEEFELDMSLDWRFMVINNVPYIVSQKTQVATTDADNK